MVHAQEWIRLRATSAHKEMESKILQHSIQQQHAGPTTALVLAMIIVHTHSYHTATTQTKARELEVVLLAVVHELETTEATGGTMPGPGLQDII